ncbi:hypothetical protein P7C70_g5822, partial [Phenoliferia sp. Uapishka_3]
MSRHTPRPGYEEQKRKLLSKHSDVDLRTSQDPLSLTCGIRARAAFNLDRFANAPPLSQQPEIFDKAMGWLLPNWTTSTKAAYLVDKRRSPKPIWYRILQQSDLLMRLKLRKTCKAFRKLYEKVDFDELDLSRVVFDTRYPKRIHVLDYVLTSQYRTSRRMFGPERKKVVAAGGVFFQVIVNNLFKRPPYVPSNLFLGSPPGDPSTIYCGVKTPGGKTSVEVLDVDIGDTAQELMWIERWTSLRSLKNPVFQEAIWWKRQCADKEWDAAEGELIMSRVPVGTSKEYLKYARWEALSLDGEGMDDTFTLEDVSHIVAGRYRSPSTKIGSWSKDFSTVSESASGGRYMMLQSFGSLGWLLMEAVHPSLELMYAYFPVQHSSLISHVPLLGRWKFDEE